LKEQWDELPHSFRIPAPVRGVMYAFILLLFAVAVFQSFQRQAAPVQAAEIEEQAAVQAAFVGTRYLVPLGNAVGIKLFADGVMVVGLTEIETKNGVCCPAADCGLLEGDMITYVGSEKLDSASELRELLQAQSGEETTLRVVRAGKQMQFSAQTVCAASGAWQLGAWVRDSMAGIGTLTFYDPDSGVFGALGHGITDIDTALLMPLSSGAIMGAEVVDVKKGAEGAPGELHGQFDLTKDLGTLYGNSACGIFGTLADVPESQKALPAGGRGYARAGKATILTTIDGTEVREYDVEITKIYSGDKAGTRNLAIRVTDPELLAATGGIVQGMSGSPIIQNGRLIGAVTHVMVSDPQCGYGVFIETMLEGACLEERATA